jgi:hypothetical protein
VSAIVPCHTLASTHVRIDVVSGSVVTAVRGGTIGEARSDFAKWPVGHSTLRPA